MKKSTKENVLFVGSALAAAVGIVAVGVILDIHDIHWGKWFELAWWTAIIFGLLAYGYGRRLKNSRPLSIFLVALAVHLSVTVSYVRSASGFPNLFFLFIAPAECAVVVAVMTLLTDLDYRPGGRRRPRQRKWPPPGWGRVLKAARKRNGHG